MEQEPQGHKAFDKLNEEIKENLHVLTGDPLSPVRTIMETRAFSEDDLHRMLRGQLLDSLGRTCRHAVLMTVDDVDDGYDLTRLVEQLSAGRPLEPINTPRNHLMCPLEERALDGERQVPCWQARRRAGISAGPDDPPLSLLIEKERLQPCEAFHALGDHFLPEILAGSIRVPAEPANEDGTAQALLAGETALSRAKEQAARDRLNYLLTTGRLRLDELSSMHHYGLPVTDEVWLPCRDDPERTVWYSPGEHDDDCPDYVADYERDLRQYRCPLQVRALLGDRTVPCSEALCVGPDEEMKARAEQYRKWAAGQGRRPEQMVPPQPETVDAAAGPGGPRDPVRLLQMRPCHLLGQLMAATLYPIALRMRDEPGFGPGGRVLSWT